MSQIWAIVAASGSCSICFTGSADEHPAQFGHEEDCVDRNVWALDREPVDRLGERVDYETGEIVFDRDLAFARIVPAIKSATQTAILRVAPLWRQLADLADPDNEAKAGRAEAIAVLRSRSNQLEDMVRSASLPSEVEFVWNEVIALEKGL